MSSTSLLNFSFPSIFITFVGITAKGSSLKEARANAYQAAEWVDFDNKYMRHDIGKAIDEAYKGK